MPSMWPSSWSPLWTGPTPAGRTVTVPGNWTLQDTGDLPHYTNVQMPFPGPPPALPAQCK